jgi:hypothetical protein
MLLRCPRTWKRHPPHPSGHTGRTWTRPPPPRCCPQDKEASEPCNPTIKVGEGWVVQVEIGLKNPGQGLKCLVASDAFAGELQDNGPGGALPSSAQVPIQFQRLCKTLFMRHRYSRTLRAANSRVQRTTAMQMSLPTLASWRLDYVTAKWHARTVPGAVPSKNTHL